MVPRGTVRTARDSRRPTEVNLERALLTIWTAGHGRSRAGDSTFASRDFLSQGMGLRQRVAAAPGRLRFHKA